MPSEKLERLTAELIAIAEQMRREYSYREDRGSGDGRIAPPVPAAERARNQALGRWGELAEGIYRCRRQRDRLFGPIFGEPAWDILLDLFVMEAKGMGVPVSSACVASGTSHSTALRQIDELVRCGLVERIRDIHDRRRTYLRLSEQGLRKLTLALEAFGGELRVPIHATAAPG
ncbi:DNA-binding MarR family transcriptional regulator [Novosphingobium chloroacetimidivorans]|uniref:DNA-binding MarR family transcriptional regulator n=1 Tax=Novosphingobium chloroacetimidivorans TaxID=1428314 RepID=A0A7W7KCF0_9SPHN|nr:MarR family transcriptional regulator [Novosphingobium chloroacetimidivorans]MBB4859950.1 DNA-binding MarR family transcriptional regulator [Novosphingobium chloroacetimidivorans]